MDDKHINHLTIYEETKSLEFSKWKEIVKERTKILVYKFINSLIISTTNVISTKIFC